MYVLLNTLMCKCFYSHSLCPIIFLSPIIILPFLPYFTNLAFFHCSVNPTHTLFSHNKPDLSMLFAQIGFCFLWKRALLAKSELLSIGLSQWCIREMAGAFFCLVCLITWFLIYIIFINLDSSSLSLFILPFKFFKMIFPSLLLWVSPISPNALIQSPIQSGDTHA